MAKYMNNSLIRMRTFNVPFYRNVHMVENIASAKFDVSLMSFS